MILYFTGSESAKYTADKIAYETEDKSISLLDVKEVSLKQGENLGFVFPTYFFGLPTIVEERLRDMHFVHAENAYVYCVILYGSVCGQADNALKKILAAKNIRLQASYAVKMPDTWTPVFNVSDPVKVSRRCFAADENIGRIIPKITAHMKHHITVKLPRGLSAMMRMGYPSARRTCHLHAYDACIGCGLCVRNCPVQAIALQENHPVWVKKECVMCLSCLHHCPVNAIQYDKKTRYHGQFVHEPYVPKGKVRKHEKEHRKISD